MSVSPSRYTVIITGTERYSGVIQDYQYPVEASSPVEAARMAERATRDGPDRGTWAHWEATAVYAGWLENLLPDDYEAEAP